MSSWNLESVLWMMTFQMRTLRKRRNLNQTMKRNDMVGILPAPPIGTTTGTETERGADLVHLDTEGLLVDKWEPMGAGPDY